MPAYYNEFDSRVAAWLRELIKRNLIAPGEVDERSITEVQPDDLNGFDQVHLFAGAGGWPLATRLAGIPRDYPVWTGSPPCQPFSSASRGRKLGLQCDRHLWPEMRRLIDACRPSLVFVEQVAAARAWVDVFCDDVEALGLAVWPCCVPAYCAAADHARERFYFACYSDGYREPELRIDEEVARLSWLESVAESVVLPDGFPVGVAFSGFGNAIYPPLATEFIAASIEARRLIGART